MNKLNRNSLDKNRIKILLLEGVHASAIETFESAGYTNIELHSGAVSPEELKSLIKNVHILGIRSRTQVTPEILSHADKLMAVGCFCIGTNQVDLQSTLIRGIGVFNAPFSNTRSVAELVIAEAILLLRGIPQKNAAAHKGGWLKSALNSYEIRGKTMGIIGYGNIGSQVSVLAEAIGMRVIFHDAVNKLPLGNATQAKNLNDMLSQADIVTMHVPEINETKNMMGAAQFEKMKDGAIFINASRGTVVDIDALADALEKKKLEGAAIDVFPVEPKSKDEEFVSVLRQYDNCLLTPHVGGSTMEAQEKIGAEVAHKLIKFSDNGSSLSSVNFPEVTLPTHEGAHRLLHIHRNTPGILSQINNFFSSNAINIRAQHLQTNQDVGYVVTDIDEDYSQMALKHLSQIDGTIKCRILF